MSVDHHQSIQFVLNRLFCWINGQSAAGGWWSVLCESDELPSLLMSIHFSIWVLFVWILTPQPHNTSNRLSLQLLPSYSVTMRVIPL